MKTLARFLCLVLASCAATPTTEPEELVFYPDPPDPPRIQFLRSISFAKDIEPPQSRDLRDWLLGEEPKPPMPLHRPGAIAEYDGVFYVTDSQLAAIYRIDFAAEKMDLAPLKGRAQLMSPMGICAGPDGKVYVADRGRRQLVVLNKDFSWNRQLGPWGDNSIPVDVAVDATRIYIADSGARCARVLDLRTGKQILELGNSDNPDEDMYGPTDLAVDDLGNIYVGDVIRSRIYVWDREGKFICHIGEPGDAPGRLARPKGIAYDDRKLWVLDSAFDNCQIFDLTGRTVLHFGGPGNRPGSMSLPRKVWVGRGGLEHFRDQFAPDFVPERLIAVTNSYGGKLAFYALGRSNQVEYPDMELPDRPAKRSKDEPEKPADANKSKK